MDASHLSRKLGVKYRLWIDGCIILGAKDESDELLALRQLREEGHPFCLINQHFEGENFHEVDADHETGSWQAVKHLLGQGFRRIAFLNGPPEYSNSRDRMKGYARAHEEEGLHWNPALQFQGNFSRRSGVQAAAEMVTVLDSIDAVFAANDRMAIGLQQGFRELGIQGNRMPAIVGYDDSDAAELTLPALSSVRVPFYQLGEIAAARVLQMLEVGAVVPFESERIQIKLPTELVVRASSCP
ncbi:substrate-binding domain-containing protein [Paenibacillus sp. BR2-3]|uniref:substrate-binding domain-containing protein n=1 Tax=Paenibacillus sp. BR2-3 TaxID=3048494 RepID=UPI003977CCAA